MPMPPKSDTDNALALLLRHVEGTTGMTEDVLTSLTNIESAVHMCRCKNAKQQELFVMIVNLYHVYIIVIVMIY